MGEDKMEITLEEEEIEELLRDLPQIVRELEDYIRYNYAKS